MQLIKFINFINLLIVIQLFGQSFSKNSVNRGNSQILKIGQILY